MKFSLESSASYLIHGYEKGQIRVIVPSRESHGPAGEPSRHLRTLTRSLIITSQEIIEDWPAEQFADIDADTLAPLLALEPELVLLGTGERLRFPPAACLSPFYQRHIGVEVMDTPAACRTYNVLVSEGRQVAAAMLMI